MLNPKFGKKNIMTSKSRKCPNCSYEKQTGCNFCCRSCKKTDGLNHNSRCSLVKINLSKSIKKPTRIIKSSCKLINKRSLESLSDCAEIEVRNNINKCTRCHDFDACSEEDIYCSSCISDMQCTPDPFEDSCDSLVFFNDDETVKLEELSNETDIPTRTLVWGDSQGFIQKEEKIGIREIVYCSNFRTGEPLYNPKYTISFLDNDSYYPEFSLFYEASIIISGKTYRTAGHYYYCQKFFPENNNIQELIKSCQSQAEIYIVSKKYSKYIRCDWESHYMDFTMREAMKAKFMQHEHLRKILLNTGTKYLVLRNVTSGYWGDSGDGNGYNRYGHILMDIRNSILLENKYESL